MKSLLFALALAGCACPRPAAPPAGPSPSPAPGVGVAALGETFTVESRVLGERRVINVYVPPGYATSGARYPVLYMPDGGMGEDFPHIAGAVDVSIKNALIRPLIVVGIENTERRRDLVGPTRVAREREAAPHAGGADRFRAFLRTELKPLIAARCRTTPETAIIGESLAGLFVVETLLVEPTLFDRYIAADPSLWWNEQAVARGAAARLATWTAGTKELYVATGDADEILQGFATFKAAVDAHPAAGIRLTYEPMPHEHHNTIFPTAALHGIRTLFAAGP